MVNGISQKYLLITTPVAITPYKMRIPYPCLPPTHRRKRRSNSDASYDTHLTQERKGEQTHKDLAEKDAAEIASIAGNMPPCQDVPNHEREEEEQHAGRMCSKRLGSARIGGVLIPQVIEKMTDHERGAVKSFAHRYLIQESTP